MFKLLFILFTASLTTCATDSCSFSKSDKNILDCCKTLFDAEADEKELTKAGSKCTNSNSNGDFCSIIKCVLNYQGLLTADKINITNNIAVTMRGKEDGVWGKVVTDAVKSCVDRMPGKDCPELFFLDCLDVTMFINCPKTEWNENETCAIVKKSFSTC